jgi:hypothetical protein
MAASRYTFTGFETPENDDPLGVWTSEATPGMAYGVGMADRGLAWRVDHEESSLAARSELLARRAKVELWEQTLDIAARSLEDLSPALSSGSGIRTPADALLAEVSALRSPVLSFGVGAEGEMRQPAAAFRGIFEQANALLLQFKRLIQHFARIETTSRGMSVALTAVDWTGDYETAWLDGASALDMTLHLEAVRLALASRHALLHLISIVTSGALSLATKASVPGGQILLIPAVYNYVRDIMRELEQR